MYVVPVRAVMGRRADRYLVTAMLIRVKKNPNAFSSLLNNKHSVNSSVWWWTSDFVHSYIYTNIQTETCLHSYL